MSGCGFTIVGFILGVFNLIMMAAGSAVIWIGYMACYETKKLFTTILPKLSESLKIFDINNPDQKVLDEISKVIDFKLGMAILILGVVIVVISLFGLFSAICQFGLFEIPYVILLGVLLIASITLTCLFAARSDLVREVFKNIEVELFKNEYKAGETKGFTKIWDDAQQKLECCGVSGFQDFSNKLTGGRKVPDSCCKNGPGCGNDPTAENAYLTGCEEKIWEQILRKYKDVVIGMGIVDVIIFIPFVFVLVLICRFKQN